MKSHQSSALQFRAGMSEYLMRAMLQRRYMLLPSLGGNALTPSIFLLFFNRLTDTYCIV